MLNAKWTRHCNLLVLISSEVEYIHAFHGQLRVDPKPGKLDYSIIISKVNFSFYRTCIKGLLQESKSFRPS